MLSIFLSTTIFALLVHCQTLSEATDSYQQLSQFRDLLKTYPSLAPPTNASSMFTVLVPDNGAFADYAATTGTTVDSLDLGTLANYFQYHTLDGSLSLDSSVDTLVNTELTGPLYDLRGNGTAGQVVFIKSATMANDTSAMGNDTSAIVKSGAGNTVNMNVINGSWEGGNFQIVNGFLTLPKTCTDTMEDDNYKLTSLVAALDRTNLTDTLNTFPNVTCLAPNNAAFDLANNADLTLPVTDLSNALLYHTLPGAQYSTGLKDGDIFQTASGGTVKVTIMGNGSTFFNNALVVNENVITNNGVIHVLDRVMSIINATETSTTSSATSSATPSTTSSISSSVTSTTSTTSNSPSASAKPNVAGKGFGSSCFPALIAVAALVI